MEPKRWYRIEASLAHQGAGRFVEIPIYVFAVDALKAFDRYKFLPGLKKSRPLDIRPLNQAEVLDLEKMVSEDGLDLEQVKSNWYTANEDYKELLLKRLRTHYNNEKVPKAIGS